jgi:hypothetical protein
VMCGVTSDHDTIQQLLGPDLVVDRTPPPAPTAVPPAPGDLWPASFQQWTFDGASDLQYVKMMVGTVPGATGYELAVQSWNGSAWVTYATWSRSTPFMKFCPYWLDHLYRFRARAKNAYGFGAWSDWSAFEYGRYTGTRPAGWGAPVPPTAPDAGTPPPPDAGAPANPPDAGTPPPADAGTPAPDAGTGGPVGLSPDDDQAFAKGGSVKLTCTAVPSASAYSFAIEYLVSGTWKAYYAYQPTANAQTFWPATATSYRFRAQAKVGGAWGPWSGFATFVVR